MVPAKTASTLCVQVLPAHPSCWGSSKQGSVWWRHVSSWVHQTTAACLAGTALLYHLAHEQQFVWRARLLIHLEASAGHLALRAHGPDQAASVVLIRNGEWETAGSPVIPALSVHGVGRVLSHGACTKRGWEGGSGCARRRPAVIRRKARPAARGARAAWWRAQTPMAAGQVHEPSLAVLLGSRPRSALGLGDALHGAVQGAADQALRRAVVAARPAVAVGAKGGPGEPHPGLAQVLRGRRRSAPSSCRHAEVRGLWPDRGANAPRGCRRSPAARAQSATSTAPRQRARHGTHHEAGQALVQPAARGVGCAGVRPGGPGQRLWRSATGRKLRALCRGGRGAHVGLLMEWKCPGRWVQLAGCGDMHPLGSAGGSASRPRRPLPAQRCQALSPLAPAGQHRGFGACPWLHTQPASAGRAGPRLARLGLPVRHTAPGPGRGAPARLAAAPGAADFRSGRTLRIARDRGRRQAEQQGQGSPHGDSVLVNDDAHYLLNLTES